MMPLLTITLVFPRLTLKPLLSKFFFHFKNLFLNPPLSKSSGPSYQLSSYRNSLSAPSLANSVTTSTTNAKRKGDSTDPWCIPTLTSNSSDNSESTLTIVFPPSYRLITDLTKTAGIPFFPNAHSNTFLGTLSMFSLAPQNTYITFFL